MKAYLFADSGLGMELLSHTERWDGIIVLFNYSFHHFRYHHSHGNFLFVVDEPVMRLVHSVRTEFDAAVIASPWFGGLYGRYTDILLRDIGFTSSKIYKPWSSGTQAYIYFKMRGYEVKLMGFDNEVFRTERANADKVLTRLQEINRHVEMICEDD